MAILTRSPIWVWSPWGKMSMSGCREQASMTVLYLEQAGVGVQPISLACAFMDECLGSCNPVHVAFDGPPVWVQANNT